MKATRQGCVNRCRGLAKYLRRLRTETNKHRVEEEIRMHNERRRLAREVEQRRSNPRPSLKRFYTVREDPTVRYEIPKASRFNQISGTVF